MKYKLTKGEIIAVLKGVKPPSKNFKKCDGKNGRINLKGDKELDYYVYEPTPSMEKVNVMGMELDRWTYESCEADFGVGEDFATLYRIESKEKEKGHATSLLIDAKKYYEKKGLRFGGTVALNKEMKTLYKKLGIKEYDNF